MAQKLYKWTGDIIEPTAWESSIKAPQWYGSDDDGVSYAFLDEDFAKLCKSSKDDLAATTASSAKTWVKTKSQEAKIIKHITNTIILFLQAVPHIHFSVQSLTSNLILVNVSSLGLNFSI